jgi:nicotinamide-nucleotide adenylyltransferase
MPKKFSVGLFIGRFQPFHKGHMHAIMEASTLCERLIVGIGSSQVSGTPDNPLTALDRIKIIKAALRGSGITDRGIKFISLPDFNDNDAWFAYIIKKAPNADVVFSRNPIVKRIFNRHKMKVIEPKWYQRGRLSATEVRRTIRKGENWQHLVPNGAVHEIEKGKEKIIKAGK